MPTDYYIKKCYFYYMANDSKKVDNSAKNHKMNKRVFQYNSPSSNEEENRQYIDALDDAIASEDVFNIGIIAPYGSGKSSLIKSYFNKHFDKKKHSCNVTLANFAEPHSKKDLNKRSIYKSILEQILFKNKHSWLSKSNLGRIHGRFLPTLIFSFFLISTISLIVLCILKSLEKLPFDKGNTFFFYFGFAAFSSLITIF